VKRAWAVLLGLAVLGWLPTAAARSSIDTLLSDLQIVPLEPTLPPAFTGRDLAGAPITLAQFRGRAVMLYFWATW
jgi:hypothetical protein